MKRDTDDRTGKRPYEAPAITQSYDEAELRELIRPQCGSLPSYGIVASV